VGWAIVDADELERAEDGPPMQVGELEIHYVEYGPRSTTRVPTCRISFSTSRVLCGGAGLRCPRLDRLEHRSGATAVATATAATAGLTILGLLSATGVIGKVVVG